jgi:Outer membrane protein beta-barrel domain
MKKIYLLSFFTGCCIAANAQINKGSILLGGQLGYYNSNVTGSTQVNQKNQGGNFSISFGKAIKENAVIGVNIGFSPSKTENLYNGTDYTNITYNRYNIGIYYTRYKKLAADFYFYAEAGAGYTGSKQTTKNISGSSKVTNTQNGGQIYITPGIAYAICKKLQLEVMMPQFVNLGYFQTKSSASPAKQNNFSVNTSLNGGVLNNLGVGFRLVL